MGFSRETHSPAVPEVREKIENLLSEQAKIAGPRETDSLTDWKAQLLTFAKTQGGESLALAVEVAAGTELLVHKYKSEFCQHTDRLMLITHDGDAAFAIVRNGINKQANKPILQVFYPLSLQDFQMKFDRPDILTQQKLLGFLVDSVWEVHPSNGPMLPQLFDAFDTLAKAQPPFNNDTLRFSLGVNIDSYFSMPKNSKPPLTPEEKAWMKKLMLNRIGKVDPDETDPKAIASEQAAIDREGKRSTEFLDAINAGRQLIRVKSPYGYVHRLVVISRHNGPQLCMIRTQEKHKPEDDDLLQIFTPVSFVMLASNFLFKEYPDTAASFNPHDLVEQLHQAFPHLAAIPELDSWITTAPRYNTNLVFSYIPR